MTKRFHLVGGGILLDNAVGSPVTIGATLHIDTYFDGYIDEVKIFSESLSDSRNWLN